jgi:hypothetical protein
MPMIEDPPEDGRGGETAAGGGLGGFCGGICGKGGAYRDRTLAGDPGRVNPGTLQMTA